MAGIRVSVRCGAVTVDAAAATREAVTAVTPVVTRYCVATVGQATVDCPVDTGTLRAHHRQRVVVRVSVVRGEVYNDTEYAEAVHNGRGAVTIRPRRRQVLRFTVGSKVVYARYARQKARRARPWLADAGKSVAARYGYEWSDQ